MDKIQKKEKVFYDPNGNILPSLAGRRNRQHKDEFIGGGVLLPDMTSLKVLEHYRTNFWDLINVTGTPGNIKSFLNKQVTVRYLASYKICKGNKQKKKNYYSYNYQDHKPTELTAEEAAQWLIDHGFPK